MELYRRLGPGKTLMLAGTIALALWFLLIPEPITSPLDSPVSLSKGHVRLGPFRLDSIGPFSVELQVQKSKDLVREYCYQPCESELQGLPIPWVLVQGGHAIPVRNRGPMSEMYNYPHLAFLVRPLGSFNAAPGEYYFEAELPVDGSRFNVLQPRVWISLDYEAYELIHWQHNRFGWAALGLLLLGMCLEVQNRLESRRIRKKTAESVQKTWAAPGPQPPFDTTAWRQVSSPTLPDVSRFAPVRPVPLGLRHFAPLQIQLLMILMFIMMIFHDEHYTPGVLRVGLRGTRGQAQRIEGFDPLVVQMDQDGGLSIQGRHVSDASFDTDLLKIAGERPPDWPIYFDGDPDLEWQQAARVIDRIHGLRLRVFMMPR